VGTVLLEHHAHRPLWAPSGPACSSWSAPPSTSPS